MRAYTYQLIGAEISATARYCDRFIQVSPLAHDDGLLLKSVDSKDKTTVADPQDIDSKGKWIGWLEDKVDTDTEEQNKKRPASPTKAIGKPIRRVKSKEIINN